MDGQRFGLHKTDAASDWLLIKRHGMVRKGYRESSIVTTLIHKRDFSIYRKEDVLFQPKIKSEVPTILVNISRKKIC